MKRALPLAMACLAIASVGFATSYEAVLVRGGSMEPALRTGDVCVVRRGLRPDSGDIALFDRPVVGGRVLHRVVTVLPDGSLQMRGDANPVCDRDPVPASSVRGSVVAVMRTGGVVSAVLAVRRR